MSKSKWLGALLVGISALGSGMANASVSGIVTSEGYRINFLSADAWLTYSLFYSGSQPGTETSDNVKHRVTLDNINLLKDDYITAGSGELKDGIYGWIQFSPTNENPVSISWDGYNVAVAAVPEPGVYALIGLGVAGLVLARRRQKKSDIALGQFAV